MAKLKQSTFSITANDFGFSLTTAEDYDFSIVKKEADYFLDNKKLEEDLENAREVERRELVVADANLDPRNK